MEFWDTFWATMWGALGGAIVAAFAAWLFSRNLAARAERYSYDRRLDEAVGRIAEVIYATISPPRSERKADKRRRRASGWAEETDRLLFAASAAELMSSAEDARVFQALKSRILEWSVIRQGNYQVIADERTMTRSALDTVRDLGSWRRGQIESAEAIRRLDRRTSPVGGRPFVRLRGPAQTPRDAA